MYSIMLIWYLVFIVSCVYTCTHCLVDCVFFFFKQKTAYEMRISDWSSDVCSSDLLGPNQHRADEQTVPRQFGNHANADAVLGLRTAVKILDEQQIGRASCRERVCQYV